ncbi:hypothetical protein NEPAR04_0669 [Nematocida parisii]|nr:hypothetical protein NEPAR03_0672 [Nematocida parisii]KAI5126921.1 hypothetical protein NEPAR08_0671 [Nematocida parisii]KAI5141031.1 hypothetical protein NEPAR04_0669 [Nematocida parisii]
MKRQLVLYAVMPFVCWCEIGKETTSRLMTNRLGQLSSMLNSILDGDIAQERAILTSTLKGLSHRYSSSKELVKKTEKTPEIKKTRRKKIEEPESEYSTTERISRTRKIKSKAIDEDLVSDKVPEDDRSLDFEDSTYIPRKSSASSRRKTHESLRSTNTDYEESSVEKRPKSSRHSIYDDEYSQEYK